MLNTSTKTVLDLTTHVKRQFGDESGVQITDADIIRWINGAQIEIVAKNNVIEGRITADAVAGTSVYNLPTVPILNIVSVHYKGLRIENTPFSSAERTIFASDPNRTQQGDPTLWYEWAGVINFWPVPDVSLVGGIVIYAIMAPANVSALSDPLSLPDKYFETIAAWCMVKAYELDEEFTEATAMMTRYNLLLDEKNGEELQGQHSTYPTITFVE
jgi:hypothetical protein